MSIQRSPPVSAPSISHAVPFSGLLAGCQTPHQPPLPVLCGPPSPPRGAAGSRTDPAPTPRSVPGGPRRRVEPPALTPAQEILGKEIQETGDAGEDRTRWGWENGKRPPHRLAAEQGNPRRETLTPPVHSV